MKKTILTLLILNCLSLTQSAFSQYFVKVLQLRPTGELGYVFKKTVGLEIGQMDDFEENWRSRWYGSFSFFTMRMDGFPTYAYVTEGSTTTVRPGTERFNLWINLGGAGGFDYSPFIESKFIPYLGFDLLAGGIIYDYESNIEAVSNLSESGGKVYIGLKGRAGVEYPMNRFTLFLEFTRQYTLTTDPAILNMNDIGFGIRF